MHDKKTFKVRVEVELAITAPTREVCEEVAADYL